MKKAIITILFIFSVFDTFAQDDYIDSLYFESEEPVNVYKPYYSIGLGYLGNFFFLNFEDINSHFLNNKFYLDELKAPLYLHGALLMIGIPNLDNTRISFYRCGGFKTILGKDTEISGNKYTNQGEYFVAYNGLSFDYALQIAKSFVIVPSLSVGYGEIIIEHSFTPNKYDWNNFLPGTNQNAYINRIEAGFWMIQPSVNFEYTITGYSMIRASAGYNYSFMNQWKFNRGAELENVPTSINSSGFYLQFGIFLGIFNNI